MRDRSLLASSLQAPRVVADKSSYQPPSSLDGHPPGPTAPVALYFAPTNRPTSSLQASTAGPGKTSRVSLVCRRAALLRKKRSTRSSIAWQQDSHRPTLGFRMPPRLLFCTNRPTNLSFVFSAGHESDGSVHPNRQSGQIVAHPSPVRATNWPPTGHLLANVERTAHHLQPCRKGNRTPKTADPMEPCGLQNAPPQCPPIPTYPLENTSGQLLPNWTRPRVKRFCPLQNAAAQFLRSLVLSALYRKLSITYEHTTWLPNSNLS